MKTFVTLAAAMTCAFSSFAFTPSHDATSRQVCHSGKSIESILSSHASGKSKKNNLRNAAQHQMATTDLITEAAGNSKLYVKDAAGYYVYANIWSMDYEIDQLAAEVVYGDNGKVWFKNIITMTGLPTYSEAMRNDDTITMNLPQTVAYSNNGRFGVNLCVLKFVDDGEYGTYEIVDEINTVEFKVDDTTDTITLLLPGEEGEYMLGLAYSDDSSWTEYGDIRQSYSPFEHDFVTLPENAEMTPCSMIEGDYGYMVEAALVNDKIYIKGMCKDMPEGVIIADYDASTSKAYITQDQYLGIIYNEYYVMTKVLTYDEEGFFMLTSPDIAYELDVDLENMIIRTSSSYNPADMPVFCFNTETDEAYFAQLNEDFTIRRQLSMAGTMREPYQIHYLDYYLDYYGYNVFHFRLPLISKEETLLDQNAIFYSLYMDGEIMEFISDYNDGSYLGIDGTLTELPFSLNNGSDITVFDTTHEIGIYVDGFDTIGLQSFYRLNGEVQASDLYTLDVLTGELTSTSTGAETICAEHILKTDYFDMNGQMTSVPAQGVYVKKTTLSDGSVKTSKVIF